MCHLIVMTSIRLCWWTRCVYVVSQGLPKPEDNFMEIMIVIVSQEPCTQMRIICSIKVFVCHKVYQQMFRIIILLTTTTVKWETKIGQVDSQGWSTLNVLKVKDYLYYECFDSEGLLCHICFDSEGLLCQIMFWQWRITFTLSCMFWQWSITLSHTFWQWRITLSCVLTVRITLSCVLKWRITLSCMF